MIRFEMEIRNADRNEFARSVSLCVCVFVCGRNGRDANEREQMCRQTIPSALQRIQFGFIEIEMNEVYALRSSLSQSRSYTK